MKRLCPILLLPALLLARPWTVSAGVVYGTIVDRAGQPLPGVKVIAYDYDRNDLLKGDPQASGDCDAAGLPPPPPGVPQPICPGDPHDYMGQAITDANGNYRITYGQPNKWPEAPEKWDRSSGWPGDNRWRPDVFIQVFAPTDGFYEPRWTSRDSMWRLAAESAIIVDQPVEADCSISLVVPELFELSRGTFAPLTNYMASANGELRGWVDMHAHPMSHLGFGGKLIHGAPDVGALMPAGTRSCDILYESRADGFNDVLTHCGPTHMWWEPLTRDCGDVLRFAVIAALEAFNDAQCHHGRGFPDFPPVPDGWQPNWGDITHQKMWIDWVYRAYRGGQRVMVALGLNNRTLAMATRGPGLYFDKAAGDQQIAEIKEMVSRHRFMEIAYSPAQLRDIVSRDKLAIVLGLELDDLGDFTYKGSSDADIRAEIERLYSLGIRYLFPVHLTDNRLGGTSVHDLMFDIANLIQTGELWTLTVASNISFKLPVERSVYTNLAGLFEGPLYAHPGYELITDPALGNLSAADKADPKKRLEGYLGFVLGQPIILPDAPPTCPTNFGHVNAKGLSSWGTTAINQMMARGMMIDIDHMSARCLQDVLGLTQANGYPLNSGHNGCDTNTVLESENSRTWEQYTNIAARGGMVGVGTGLNVDNFVVAYTNTVAAMRQGNPANINLGLGTDMNGMWHGPAQPSSAGIPPLDYTGLPHGRTGVVEWDYNANGVGHYGMLPDFLVHIGQRPGGATVLSNIFGSAEGFARMWEKCLTVSHAMGIVVEQPVGTVLTHGGPEVNCGLAELAAAPTVRTFTVRNTGIDTLTGLAVSKDGANSADFAVGPLGATELAPGTSTTFKVTFTPSALGQRRAAIHLASNDADPNPFDIFLVGAGVPPVTITSDNPLPCGTVGSPYSLSLATGGGAPPLTWSVVGGTLPPGLSLNNTGLLGGTPTVATNLSFTVRVTGGGGSSSDTKAFDLRILGPTSPGALDIAFGIGGRVTTGVAGPNSRASAMTVQSDGKLLVAGSAFNGSDYDFALLRYLANGSLDNAFGNQGLVTTPLGSSQDHSSSVAVQSDGKIIVAGDAYNGNDSDFALVRYLPNGTLDTGFGSGGKVITPIAGSSGDVGKSVAVQADGKLVVAGYADNGNVTYDFAVVRYLADGTLDLAFGSGGKVLTPIGSANDCGASVGVQSDGKIVVTGYSVNGSGDNDFALVRYLSNGALDSTFGSGGKVITTIGLYGDSGQSLIVQSDGKIVIAGDSANSAGNGDFALVRYLANGTLDTTFGSGGKVTTDIANGFDDSGHSVALQSDGKIVVAGSTDNGGNYDFALVRYLANGNLDTAFGSDGKMTTPVGVSDDIGWSVAVQSDGKIVVAGDSRNGSDYDFALVRYLGTTEPEIAVEQPAGNNLTDGSAIVGFGNLALDGGPATRWFTVRNASTASLTGLAVIKDGVNAGDFTVGSLGATTLGPGENTLFAVSCLPGAVGLRTAAIHIASNDADENPFDITLTGTGCVPPQIATDSPLPSGMVGAAYDLSFAATGGLAPYTWSLISGNPPASLSLSGAGALSGTPSSVTTTNFTLRVTDDYGFSSTKVFALTIMPVLKSGALDSTFGNGGKVTLDFGSADDYGYSAAMQSDGKIVVAGYSMVGNYEKFALARYLSDGTLDPSFGNGGKVTTSLSLYRDYGRSLALQSDGKILVAGEYSGSGYYSLALVRYQANGALDTTFGSGGKVTPSFGAAFYAKTVMVQGDGTIFVAGDVSARCADFGLVHCLADGSLDGTFGTGGRVTTDFGTNSCDYPQGAVLQADGKILVTGYAPGTSDSDFALLRYLSNGALDTSFGSGGKVTTPVGTYQEYGRSVVVQSDGKIVVAGELSGGNFALVRYLADGMLDSGFGSGGKVTTAINNYGGYGRSVAVQSDGKIVVAGYCSNGGNSDFAVARYNTNGTLDVSFGTGGKLLTAIGSGHDHGRSVVLQRDGKIVVAGDSYNGTNYDFALVRYIGSLEPELAVEQPAGANLTDSGSGVAFGAVGLGATPVARAFTVRNVGSACLTGLALAKDGAHAGDFAVDALATTGLAPGASISFTVTFAPGALGPRTAALHLASNDPDENPFDIALAGTGGGSTPLQAWRLAHFGSADNSGDGANRNDFDKDGVQNLLEYAFGGDPNAPDAATMRPTPVFAGGMFSFSFKCDAHCADITYTVQASSSLEPGSWTDIARSVGGGTLLPVESLSGVSDPGAGLRLATVTPSAALFSTGRGFFRIMVSE